jgi:glycosyltransferase involved in cell wall biosynthesis
MISIIIPLYNKEKFVARTLHTVMAQTFQNFEIVIVNDGSTDGSVNEVKKINDSRIRLIHQENAGVSAARNRGIQEAKYDLLAFLDADDEWKPEYLQTQYELAQKYPECDVFACNYEFRNESGKTTPTIINKLPFTEQDGVLDNYFEVASCSHPPLWTSAVMVRKDAILSVGGFPVGVKSGEDLLTWARLAVRYKIVYSKRVGAVFVQEQRYAGKLENRIDRQDVIGNELLQLYHNEIRIKEKNDLSHYLIRWHKISSVLFIEIGDTALAKKAIKKAFNVGASIKDVKIQWLLSFLPGKMAKWCWSILYKFQ